MGGPPELVTRPIEEIELILEFVERTEWYYRYGMVGEEDRSKWDADIIKDSEEAKREYEEDHPDEAARAQMVFGELRETYRGGYEYGWWWGVLSTLRWVRGEEWGEFDTKAPYSFLP